MNIWDLMNYHTATISDRVAVSRRQSLLQKEVKKLLSSVDSVFCLSHLCVLSSSYWPQLCVGCSQEFVRTFITLAISVCRCVLPVVVTLVAHWSGGGWCRWRS